MKETPMGSALWALGRDNGRRGSFLQGVNTSQLQRRPDSVGIWFQHWSFRKTQPTSSQPPRRNTGQGQGHCHTLGCTPTDFLPCLESQQSSHGQHCLERNTSVPQLPFTPFPQLPYLCEHFIVHPWTVFVSCRSSSCSKCHAYSAYMWLLCSLVPL